MQPEWLTSTVTAFARSCAPPCSHSTSNFTREIVRLWLRSLSQRSCRATPAGLVAILVVIGDLTVGDLSGPGQEVTITLGMAKVNSTLSTVLSWPLGQEKGGSRIEMGINKKGWFWIYKNVLFNLITTITYAPKKFLDLS